MSSPISINDGNMTAQTETPGARRIAEVVREACVEAALAGYESAAISGLCHEGAWEAAISAIRSMDLDVLVAEARDDGRD